MVAAHRGGDQASVRLRVRPRSRPERHARLTCAGALRRAVAVPAVVVAMAGAVVGLVAQGATDHPGQYDRTDVERGSRLYAAQCAGCHGANGDLVARVDLTRGVFTSAATDDDLARVLSTGRPASGMPAFATLLPAEVTGLIAYIRAGFDAGTVRVGVGDPLRGSAIFAGKGECMTCHRVNGRGAYSASDLSDIGAVRSPASLQRAITDPASFIIPANRAVRAVTRGGRTIGGRRVNEDTFTIQVRDDTGRLISLDKATLRSLEILTGTTMPSYASRLTPDELGDVLGYLLSLKAQ